ncbi:hypothetical protein JOC34_002616 [Virgibacillus halotolerans]|uniref:CBO0543 family protein n=1 Tax=Virgibacillus halotolerans TaxID=1071053 RepID=UPI0019604C48|nr:CBO0543 family protein [Virgibacillus halotolerans]MBM7600225.1 hypothetical protein [Virgibacillus halotolerans]
MINQIKPVDIETITEIQRHLLEANYHYWIEHVLFSFNWWFLLVLSIVPWIIWWQVVDKTRLLEISLMGTLAIILAITFDTAGYSLVLWSYGYKLVQMTPSLSSIDLALLPVAYMLIYQLFPKWKSYFIAHVIFSVGGSFVMEPLFVWMGIYTLHGWQYIYSFPIYIVMGIGFKWLILKMDAKQTRAKNKVK